MFGLKGILPSIRGCNFQERSVCVALISFLFLYASIQGISGPLWPLKQTLPADIIGFEGFVHVTKSAGKIEQQRLG